MPERLRSIVPMFGGATNYVDTLDAILEFVRTHEPTVDELIGWHRGRFNNVSSSESISRRIDYLAAVGFIQRSNETWQLGPEGETYVADPTDETLIEIMCRRNMGFRSLLYALSAGPMTLEEISHQQVNSHPELNWNPENTDMAAQRANWLRSLGLVQKDNGAYTLTEIGWDYVEDAIEQWSEPTEAVDTDSDPMTASTYETTVQARSIDPEFRATVLSRFDGTCAVSDVDHRGLLDVAHILPWSEHPDLRVDLRNALPLSKLHHAAFDRGLFTIGEELRLRVHPEFESDSGVLQETIIARDGERIPALGDTIDPSYLSRRNASLSWVAD